MEIEEIKEKLEFYNDPKFVFDEPSHIYTYNNEITFTSITTFIHRFQTPFNSDYWANKKAVERRDGTTKQDILNEWSANAKIATDLGTYLHTHAENVFNGVYTPIPNDIRIVERINKFNLVYATRLSKLTPIALEKRLFNIVKKLAGTLDGLMYDSKNKKIYIIDYKTNKKPLDECKYKKYLLKPFNKYLDTSKNMYQIQLAMYSLMLEDVGILVDDAFLIHIPEIEETKIHKCEDLKDMKEILKNYFENDYNPDENVEKHV